MAVQSDDNMDGANTGIESIDPVIAVPTSKLDADQYSADDIDGVTESVFGSGNMAYASLQASQTDAQIAQNEGTVQNAEVALEPFQQDVAGRDIPVDTDRPIDIGNESGESIGDEGGFANSTVGSVSASTLSNDRGTFSENLKIDGDVFGGDTISSASATSSTANTNNSEVNEINEINQDNRVSNEDNSSTVVNNYFVELGDGEISLDLAANVLDTLGLDLFATIDDSIEGALDITAVTSNLTNIANQLTGLDLSVLDTGLGANIVFDLLNGGNGDDPNDITIGGLDLPDIRLDPIEDIIGDIDINIDLPLGLLDVSDLVDGLADAIQSLNNFEIADISDIVGTIGAQGIDGTLDAVLGSAGLNETFDVNVEDIADVVLDPLDDLTGGVVGDVVDEALGAVEPIADIVDDVVDTVEDVLEPVTDALADLGEPLADILDDPAEAVDGVIDALTGLGGGGDATLGDAVDEVAEAVGDTLDGVTGGLTGDVTDGVEDTVDTVTDIVDDLTGGLEDVLAGDVEGGAEEIVGDVLGGLGEIGDNLPGGLGGLGDILGGGNDDPDAGDGLISDTLDPTLEDVGNVVDDLTGGTTLDVTEAVDEAIDDVTDIADALTEPLTGGILGTGNDNEGGTDSDVTADLDLGIIDTEVVDEVVEVALDPVEDLIGDVDLGLGLGADIFGDNETDNDAGDTDITADLGIDIVDNTIADFTEDIPLDHVEELTGDIDLDIGAGIDVLGDLADPIVNGGEGGTGEGTVIEEIGEVLEDVGETILGGLGGDSPVDDLDLGDALGLLGGGYGEDDDAGDGIANWTESTITDGAGMFDDIANDLGGGDDILPDPVGTVAEGIGVLDIEPEIDLGSIGGLFG